MLLSCGVVELWSCLSCGVVVVVVLLSCGVVELWSC